MRNLQEQVKKAFCYRIDKINIFIILPSKKKKTPWICWIFFENWKKWILLCIIIPSIKNSLNILGLLCRFEEIDILIILPSKKTLSLRNWKKKYFYYSTKQKDSLNIQGLLCKIGKNGFITPVSKKKPH